MQSKTNLRMTLATISSLEGVLRVTSHKIGNLIFRLECPRQPPTLPSVLPRRLDHLPKHRRVADQLPEPNPRRSHQIHPTQTIRSSTVGKLLGRSKPHPLGVREERVLLPFVAFLDHDASGGDVLKVTNLITRPTTAMVSLNLRTMTQSHHLRTLNPAKYMP